MNLSGGQILFKEKLQRIYFRCAIHLVHNLIFVRTWRNWPNKSF